MFPKISKWIILFSFAIGFISFGGIGYIATNKIKKYKNEIISQKNVLVGIIDTLSAQQNEFEKIKKELGTVQEGLSNKTEVLGTIIAKEKEKRATETKNLEEKIRQTELKRAATEFAIKNREESTQNKILAIENIVSKTKTYDLASIISQWQPIIATVECEFRYADINKIDYRSSGSGIAIQFNNTPISILTNKHVVTDKDGQSAGSCKINLLNLKNLFANSSDITSADGGYDLGHIYLGNQSPALKELVSVFPNLCRQKPSTGDEIVVLGYPAIGSKESITATEGIVSGFDGDYFITSAKVEQGNSGGAAILLKDNCLLGVPTFVTLGKVESLARILDIWVTIAK